MAKSRGKSNLITCPCNMWAVEWRYRSLRRCYMITFPLNTEWSATWSWKIGSMFLCGSVSKSIQILSAHLLTDSTAKAFFVLQRGRESQTEVANRDAALNQLTSRPPHCPQLNSKGHITFSVICDLLDRY